MKENYKEWSAIGDKILNKNMSETESDDLGTFLVPLWINLRWLIKDAVLWT